MVEAGGYEVDDTLYKSMKIVQVYIDPQIWLSWKLFCETKWVKKVYAV